MKKITHPTEASPAQRKKTSSGSSPKALVALCGGAGLAGMAMAVWWKRRHAADVSEAPPAGAASDGPALL